MPKYKWESPHEWLINALTERTHDVHEMDARIRELILKTDADTLQEVFEDLMDNDGYFEEVK